MICCSVKFLPPTTTVCADAEAMPNDSAAAARSPVSFDFNMEFPLFGSLPCGTRRSAQRVYPSRDQPELTLSHEKIDDDRQDARRDRAGEQHTRLHQVDSGENQFA